eukprot:Amastigsp_a517534_57.p3 type:complete len:147 gc:universal Amastigsp_a517534_57:315-755(+)
MYWSFMPSGFDSMTWTMSSLPSFSSAGWSGSDSPPVATRAVNSGAPYLFASRSPSVISSTSPVAVLRTSKCPAWNMSAMRTAKRVSPTFTESSSWSKVPDSFAESLTDALRRCCILKMAAADATSSARSTRESTWPVKPFGNFSGM